MKVGFIRGGIVIMSFRGIEWNLFWVFYFVIVEVILKFLEGESVFEK